MHTPYYLLDTLLITINPTLSYSSTMPTLITYSIATIHSPMTIVSPLTSYLSSHWITIVMLSPLVVLMSSSSINPPTQSALNPIVVSSVAIELFTNLIGIHSPAIGSLPNYIIWMLPSSVSPITSIYYSTH